MADGCLHQVFLQSVLHKSHLLLHTMYIHTYVCTYNVDVSHIYITEKNSQEVCPLHQHSVKVLDHAAREVKWRGEIYLF